jgi:hypothetical protein
METAAHTEPVTAAWIQTSKVPVCSIIGICSTPDMLRGVMVRKGSSVRVRQRALGVLQVFRGERKPDFGLVF